MSSAGAMRVPVHVTLGPPPGAPYRSSEAPWERVDTSLRREKTADLFLTEDTSSCAEWMEQEAERLKLENRKNKPPSVDCVP